MVIIVPEIHTLEQHLHQLDADPEFYRPDRCPHCGCAGLWFHGFYNRYPDRDSPSNQSLNPVPILRFLCPQDSCGRTCSVLPECIPPRRWFLWSVQQTFLLLLLGKCLPEKLSTPHPRTVWRWWQRLRDRFHTHRFCLASLNARWGQYTCARTFWSACFRGMTFSAALFFIHQSDEVIP